MQVTGTKLAVLINACGHATLWHDMGGPHYPLTWFKEDVWRERERHTRLPSSSSVAVSEGLQSSRDSQAGPEPLGLGTNASRRKCAGGQTTSPGCDRRPRVCRSPEALHRGSGTRL